MITAKAVAPAIAASRGAVLSVVGSRSLARAQALAAPFGARAVEGYGRVVDDPAVDAVYIALPNALHGGWILKAARAGKHVICEKPAVMTVREAERVLDACARAGVRFLEAYTFRFHPQHAAAVAIIQRGTLGDVFHVDAAFGFPPLPAGNFRYETRLGGGSLYDVGGYTIAAARLLFGEEPEAVSATVHRDRCRGVDLRGSVQLRFRGGRTAHGVFGFTYGYRNTYAVWGARGRLVSERAFSVPPTMPPPITVTTTDGTRTVPTPAADQFLLMVEAFCQAVGSGSETERSFETDFLAQTRAVEAAAQAARHRQWVTVTGGSAAFRPRRAGHAVHVAGRSLPASVARSVGRDGRHG
jgi:predicted dehydrogenase